MQLSTLRTSILLFFFFSIGSLVGQEYNFSSSVTVAIPDNLCPTYASSGISVSSVPTDGTIQLQKVGVNIVHPNAGNLDIRLKAPNGTTVELSTDNGNGGSNYSGTFFVFNGIIAENGSITAGFPPFFGNYTPEGNPFTNFGANLNGTWILEICDDTAGQTGSVVGWSLTFGKTSRCDYNDTFIWCTNSPKTGNATGAGNHADINTYTQNPHFCLIPNPGQNNYSGPDVWYTMTVPDNGYVTINLYPNTTNVDLDLFVFSKDCANNNSPVCLFSINEGGADEEITTYLNAGTYSIVVDGKTQVANPAATSNFTLSVTSDLCTWCSVSPTCVEPQNDAPLGPVYQCENFDNYASSGITAQSALWRKWLPTATDAPVVANPLAGGGKVLKIERTHIQQNESRVDVMYLLNNHQTGRYRLSWNMYIPNGKTGNFSLQHTQMGGALGNSASYVAFNGSGSGTLQIGGGAAAEATFLYQTNTWNKIVQIIDLGLDKAELWINNEFIYSWQFSRGDAGTQLQLGALHLFDLPANTLFYIDNFCLRKADCTGIQCTGDNNPKCIKNGTTYATECEARCAGYTMLDWENCTSCDLASCNEPLDDQPVGDLIICDNFDGYLLGGIDSQTYRWQRKTPASDDAAVAANPVGQGKVLKIERVGAVDPDILFFLGNQTQGRFRFSWNMYIPSGKEAYFNIQHNQTPGNRAYEVSFGPSGKGYVRVGASAVAADSFLFFHDAWNKVMQIIDIGANKVELWINGQFVTNWNFALGSSQISSQLYWLNFYANPNNLFYVDNICLRKMTCTGIICPGQEPVCMRNGQILDSECEARCFGYTSEEWEYCTSVCDAGGTLIHRGDTFDGTMTLTDNPPSLVRSVPQVIAAFGGNLPNPLYGLTFIFDNEPGGTISPIYTMLPTGAKSFIFRCVCGSPLQPTGCQQVYFGPGDQTYTNAPGGFYYIVILGGNTGAYGFSIVPTNACSTNPTNLSCGDLIAENVAAQSNFSVSNGSYSSCYNGTREYGGGESFFDFTLDQPTSINVIIDAAEPTGVFIFSYLCDRTCIAYAENPPGGGQAKIENLFLNPGIYYVIVDKEDTNNQNRSDSGPDFELNYFTTCEENVVYTLPFLISEETSACAVVENPSHIVGIYNTAFPSFAASDLLTFYFNSADSLKTNNYYLNKFWNGGPLLNFNIPQDDLTLNPKCSYVPIDTFQIFMTRTGNGANPQYLKMRPHYVQPGNLGATATKTFTPGATSIIDGLVQVSQTISFTVTPNVLNPPANPTTPVNISITTNLEWEIIKEPSATWITANPMALEGPAVVALTLQPNPERAPRSTVLKLVSRNPGLPIFEETVTVTQAGACVGIDASLEASQSTLCQGDSTVLSVVVDSALFNIYQYQWNTGQTTRTVTLHPASTAIDTVIVKDLGCFINDTLFTQIQVLDSPDAPVSTGDQSLCEGTGTAQLSVTQVPGVSFNWYDASVDGNLVQENSAVFTTGQPGTYYVQANYTNPPGCVNPNRTAVSLLSQAAPTAEAGSLSPICAGETVQLNGSTGGSATSSTWDDMQAGGQFSNPNATNSTYTPPADFFGSITLRLLTNDPPGDCDAASDEVVLEVFQNPTVEAGADLVTCVNTAIALNGQSNNVVSSVTWTASVPNGSFQNANAAATNYTPPPGYTGPITLTLTSDDPAGPCPAVSNHLTLMVGSPPTANAGADQNICGVAPVNLTGNDNNSASGVTWSASASGGNFANPNVLNTVYTPPGDFFGDITLTLTATRGNCPQASDQLILRIDQPATVTAPIDFTTCSGSAIELNGGFGGGASSVTWSASVAGGTFSPSANTPVVEYTPPASHLGPIQFTLTSNDPAGVCPPAAATVSVTVIEAPTANAGANQTVCEGTPVALNGSTNVPAGSAQWTASAPGGQFDPNAFDPHATYFPPDDVLGPITITFTAAINNCPPASGNMTLTVNPAATVTASAENTTLCAGLPAFLHGQIGGSATSATWSSSMGGTFIPSANALNPTFLPPNGFSGFIALTLRTNDPPGICSFVESSVLLTINPPLSVTIDNDAPICEGESTALSANVVGGGGGFTYHWSNSLPDQPVVAVQPTVSTVYSLTVTDSAGCQATTQEEVVVSPAVVVNLGMDRNICPGTSTTITAQIVGGIGPHTYSWSTNESTASIVVSPNELTHYQVIVTDGIGCQGAGFVNIGINPPVQVDAGNTQSVCAGTSFTLTANPSGVGGFSYNWNNGLGAGQSHTLMTNNTTTYSVTVTDSNNCMASDQVTVNITQPPVAIAGLDNEICVNEQFQLSGILQGTAVTGTWNANVSGGSFQPNNAVSNPVYHPPLNYTGPILLNFTSNATPPCPASTDQLELTINPAPVISIVSASCDPTLTSYSISLTTTGDNIVPSIGTSIQTGAGQFTIGNIPADNPVTITAISMGCSTVQQVNAPECDCQQPGQEVGAPDVGDNVVVCEGDPIPALTASVSGGLIVNWYASNNPNDTIPLQPMGSNNFTPTQEGIYYAEAENPVSGCVSLVRVPVSLVIKERPIADAGEDQIVCRGDTVVLQATEGDFYEYEWSTGSDQPTIEVTADSMIQYILTVTKDDCQSRDTVTVSAYPDIHADLLAEDIVHCQGDSTGILTVSPSGGVPPFEVLWSTGATNETISQLPAGTYNVSITDAADCVIHEAFVLDAPDSLYLEYEISPAINGQPTGAVDITVVGGDPDYIFVWTTIDGDTISMNEDINGLAVGLYVVQTIDGRQCIRMDTFEIRPLTGVSAPDWADQIKIFPNPTRNSVNIAFDLTNPLDLEFELQNLLGQTVLIRKSDSIQKNVIVIELNEYPSGIYLLKIQSGLQGFTTPIIKQ